MGHAEFEWRPAVAQDSVTVGLPRSHGCVSKDRGAGVAIDDFPSSGIGPPGLPCDGIEATLIAVAFPVALEGESDARGKRLPGNSVGVVGLEWAMMAPDDAFRWAGVTQGPGQQVVAQEDSV